MDMFLSITNPLIENAKNSENLSRPKSSSLTAYIDKFVFVIQLLECNICILYILSIFKYIYQKILS